MSQLRAERAVKKDEVVDGGSIRVKHATTGDKTRVTVDHLDKAGKRVVYDVISEAERAKLEGDLHGLAPAAPGPKLPEPSVQPTALGDVAGPTIVMTCPALPAGSPSRWGYTWYRMPHGSSNGQGSSILAHTSVPMYTISKEAATWDLRYSYGIGDDAEESGWSPPYVVAQLASPTPTPDPVPDPQPGPNPDPGPVPSGHLLARYDFESGRVEDYGAPQTFGPGGASIQVGTADLPARFGSRYYQALVDGNTSATDGGKTLRSHLHLPYVLSEGKHLFIGDPIRHRAGNGHIGSWQVSMEMFGPPWSGSPLVGVEGKDQAFVFTSQGMALLGQIAKAQNQWIDIIHEVLFTKGNGFWRVWAAPAEAGKTSPLAGSGNRFKIGELLNFATLKPDDAGADHMLLNCYMDSSNGRPMAVHHDEVRIADTFEMAVARGA